MFVQGKVRRARRSSASVRPGFRPTMDAMESRQLLTVAPFLQGTAFNDSNANGLLDTNESPLAGATVALYAANAATPLATTTTGTDGGYLFNGSNVPGGLTVGATYNLVESAAGYSNTGAQALSAINPASVSSVNTIQVTVVDPNAVLASLTSAVTFPPAKYAGIYYSLDGVSEFVNPTQLNFNLSGAANVNPATFPSLCVGVNDRLNFNQPFATVIDPQSAMTSGGQIAYLYNHYGTSAITSATAVPASIQGMAPIDIAAGLQVAIWEVEYGSRFALAGTNLGYTSAQDYADIQTAAAAFIADSAGKSEKVAILDASLTGIIPTASVTAGGQSVLAASSLNFGNKPIPPGALSGFVYADADNSGAKDAGEAGLGGISLTLVNPATGTTIATTSTATDGSYSFPNLAPGTYKVVEGAVGSYLPSKTNAGSLTGVVVTAGSVSPNNNFGEVLPGTVAGFVYADGNGNGSRNDGEKGLGGITLTLVNATTGATVGTTSTAADGSYSFANLPPGAYAVIQGAVAGYQPTVGNTGSVTGITVTQGSKTSNVNFGEIQPGSIAGVVYLDKTGNGLSSDDTALAGVTVQLVGPNGAVLASQKVGSTGAYNFTNLAPGTYTVREVTPTGYVQTAPTALTYTVPLVSGQVVTGDNFDNYQVACTSCAVGCVSYTVVGPCGVSTYSDLGGNTDQGDQVTVNFTVGGNSPATFTLVTYTATSNFDLTKQSILSVDTQTFAPGQHSLTVTIPNSYYQIDFVCGAAIANFNPAANITYHGMGRFIDSDNGGSESVPASFAGLAGTVFLDNNYDGTFGGSDTGLGGVTVKLTGKDVNGVAVALTRVTAKDGSYNFAGLQPGTYSVKEVAPSGYQTTKNSAGTAGGTVSGDTINAVTLAGGVTATKYNFGEQAAGAALGCNQTASVGFWNGCSGQSLIKSLNGNSNSTKLGNWLASTFPNSLSSLAGKTNAQVASFFQSSYCQGRSSALTEGLATALAVYATDSDLAGGNYASCYGLKVTSAGTGVATINIGTTLACYGGPTGTVSILQLLQFADANADNCDAWFQYRLACVFDYVNGCGNY